MAIVAFISETEAVTAATGSCAVCLLDRVGWDFLLAAGSSDPVFGGAGAPEVASHILVTCAVFL